MKVQYGAGSSSSLFIDLAWKELYNTIDKREIKKLFRMFYLNIHTVIIIIIFIIY